MSGLVIGVTSFQGDVEEHLSSAAEALRKLGVDGKAITVKTLEEVEAVDGLIIPGGESTVMGRLATYSDALQLIRRRLIEGMPALGTCAGLIFLAKRVYDRVVGETKQPIAGVLDITVERNTYGRQRDSFETFIDIPLLGVRGFKAVFIRAPAIVEVDPHVEVLANLHDKPIAVRQGAVMGTTFHPELSGQTIFHEILVEMANQYRRR